MTLNSNPAPASYGQVQPNAGNSYVLGQQSSQSVQPATVESQTEDNDRSVGGERVIKPLPQYANAGPSPKINIDELLAENNYSGTVNNTFPR